MTDNSGAMALYCTLQNSAARLDHATLLRLRVVSKDIKALADAACETRIFTPGPKAYDIDCKTWPCFRLLFRTDVLFMRRAMMETGWYLQGAAHADDRDRIDAEAARVDEKDLSLTCNHLVFTDRQYDDAVIERLFQRIEPGGLCSVLRYISRITIEAKRPSSGKLVSVLFRLYPISRKGGIKTIDCSQCDYFVPVHRPLWRIQENYEEAVLLSLVDDDGYGGGRISFPRRDGGVGREYLVAVNW